MITREVVAERSDGPIPFSIPWFIVAAVLAAAAVAVWLGLPPSAGRIAGVVLLAVAVLVTAGVAVYYLVRREEQLDVLGESYPLRELKKVRCHISYPFLADPYGTLRLVFSDGRKVRCRCVADVKEVYAYFIGVIQKFSKEDAVR